MTVIKRETIAEFRDDAEALFQADWQETNPHADKIPLAMDYARYDEIEQEGRLFIFAARDDEGRLVGYIGFIEQKSMQHQARLAGCTGLFICKEHRGRMLAMQLIRSALDALKAEGIVKVSISSGPMHDIGPMLARFGFIREEIVYSTVL